jgi:pimeloyl-ACP methyl ester carboxylesterase
MVLNYKDYGSGEPLIILHGFMGSLDNWHTLATQFGSSHHVFSLDQRNHGKSPHSDEHSIDLMVADLKNFIETKGLNNVSLLGHSMGGKVVMKFTLQYPNLVKTLVVVDIAPRQYQRGHDDVFEAIFAVDLTKIENRKQAEEMMLPFVADFGTRQFLLKNLERQEDGKYTWKMNLRTLHIDYHEIVKPIESDMPFLGPTLVVKGGNSRYISTQDEADFKQLFPNYQLQVIANAGHWVHAEAPKEFASAIENFLTKS